MTPKEIEQKLEKLKDEFFYEFSEDIEDINFSSDVNKGKFSLHITQRQSQKDLSSLTNDIIISIKGSEAFIDNITEFIKTEASDLEIR